MSIEAMKQALEALDYLQGLVDTERGPKAAAALRQAIEQAEKQEPVCPYCHDSHTLGAVYYDQNCVGCVKRMTATPQPQREWVGLTDDEVIKCTPTWGGTVEDVARAVEAKLKEKNA
jgi:nucleoside-diphosphate-sugar epimerase